MRNSGSECGRLQVGIDRLGTLEPEAAMFTGLVETIAEVIASAAGAAGKPAGCLAAPTIAAEAAVGESIAVNGCCLTVVRVRPGAFGVSGGAGDAFANEPWRIAARLVAVNLERSLEFGDRLGGHLVTGHIDGVGTVDQRNDDREWSTFWFRVPRELSRQMAVKGFGRGRWREPDAWWRWRTSALACNSFRTRSR